MTECSAWQAEVLYRTPIWRIGKHEWRMVVYIHPRWGNCTGFEWRKSANARWSRDVDWARYNGDHCDAGCRAPFANSTKPTRPKSKRPLTLPPRRAREWNRWIG